MTFLPQDITPELANLLIVSAKRPELVHDGFIIDGTSLQKNVIASFSQHPNEPPAYCFSLGVYACIDWDSVRKSPGRMAIFSKRNWHIDRFIMGVNLALVVAVVVKLFI